jgi:hypothetical protein
LSSPGDRAASQNRKGVGRREMTDAPLKKTFEKKDKSDEYLFWRRKIKNQSFASTDHNGTPRATKLSTSTLPIDAAAQSLIIRGTKARRFGSFRLERERRKVD